MRERFLGVTLAAFMVFFLGPPPPLTTTSCASTLPYSLTHLDGAQQVVVVMTDSWSTSSATLRAYELRGGWDWCQKIKPVKARIGYNGFVWAKDRKQSTGTTPAGTFALLWAFGNNGNPGTKLSYRSVDGNDWWAYDPKSPTTYNRWLEHGLGSVRSSWAEHLQSYGTQYAHAVVLDYNLPTSTKAANTTKGGGIFLHVNGSGATAGCVSVTHSDLDKIMKWLDPAKHPVIVMAPKASITKA
jgi:L,D-peptidoglycan transpeptidase YkuD (ErfK/YbiS/YcfS/YnhG family)